MPEFFGICGRFNPRPCKLVWASSFHPRVGTYPSSLLPSTRTIWYAATDGGYNFLPPVISPGESFGLPILGGFTIPGQFSTQFGTFTPITRFVINFCRTSNRLNVAHVLNQTEVDSINPDTGIGEINVGEYIYDAICVTDQTEAIETELTEQELNDIADGSQSESDRAFRKLFEQDIPESRNRLSGVKVNKIGIEYRLDNGDPKAVSALDDSGSGFFVGPNAANEYRDGSSKTLLVNLTKITERLPLSPGDPEPPAGSLQAEARIPKVGDVVYLSYVAIREHYIRQSVNVSWSITAMSLPPQCFSNPTKMKVCSFRFYEWEVQPAEEGQPNERVSGWRIVETDNAPVNFVAPMGLPGEVTLGDFIIGGGSLINNVIYMPANSTVPEIEGFISNRASMPIYTVNLNRPAGDASYHENAGIGGNNTAFRNAPWFLRGNYSAYQDWRESQKKVLFNVHPKALKKRDTDKFGVERFLATELQQDLSAGRLVFFPFMDDETVDNPTAGSSVSLSSANCKFDPIKPLSQWTVGNGEVECGVVGGVALRLPGTSGDVIAAFGISSPIITERFEIDTRVLIEKFGHEGHGGGTNTVAIEGLAGPTGAISCLTDRMQKTIFTTHLNSDNLLLLNKFDYGELYEGMRKLQYRPDQPTPFVEDNLNPIPSQFQKLIGYSGMLGDTPGYKPGRIISCSMLSDKYFYKYKTTSKERLQIHIPSTEDSKIEQISIAKESGKIIIPVSTAYCGSSEIEYSFSASEVGKNTIDLLILFKSGVNIEYAIDSMSINAAVKKTINIDHRWVRCDSIELIGENIDKITIDYVTITQLEDEIANDFLNEQSSSAQEDKNAIDRAEFFSKSIFFETDAMSMGQDYSGNLFIFFGDKDGSISCVQSNDLGASWIYYYGIVEPMNNLSPSAPFVVDIHNQNKCVLFYLLNGKVMCKNIEYSSFLYEDAMLIERFEADRLVLESNGMKREKIGLYSDAGKSLRRGSLSYVAAGNLTDLDFLGLLGKIPESGEFEPKESRIIEYRDALNGNIRTKNDLVYKNPVSIGCATAFTNMDLDDFYFSAYRTENGELRLMFLGDTDAASGGGQQLQCHFSNDDGKNWYDYWEFIENQYNRLRADRDKKTQFIDKSAGSSPVDDIFAIDPFEVNSYSFGINVHFSRLFRHKTNGEKDINAPSQILPISSPYAFFHPFMGKVFLFYIYNNCLLCKMFDESIFSVAADRKIRLGSDPYTDSSALGMTEVKKAIEQNSRSYFIDGDLSSNEIREEIHFYTNTATNERQIEGNIILHNQYGIDRFNSDRSISTQRVCAYRFDICNVRVFYKLSGSNDLHAATWTGTEWHVEDFMKDPKGLPDITFASNPNKIQDVVGGFGISG